MWAWTRCQVASCCFCTWTCTAIMWAWTTPYVPPGGCLPAILLKLPMHCALREGAIFAAHCACVSLLQSLRQYKHVVSQPRSLYRGLQPCFSHMSIERLASESPSPRPHEHTEVRGLAESRTDLSASTSTQPQRL